MKKVMVVDDSNVMRDLIHHLLTEKLANKIVIKECENGADAVATHSHFLPDLVITDIVMPEMDGLALISYLKSNKNVLVLAISSGFNQDSGSHAALGVAGCLGADVTLCKSKVIAELGDLVESLLLTNSPVKNGNHDALESGSNEPTVKLICPNCGSESVGSQTINGLDIGDKKCPICSFTSQSYEFEE